MLCKRLVFPVLSLATLWGTDVWAHPGHGATEPDSVSHYVIEPIHGWWILGGFVLLAVAVGIAFRAKATRKESVVTQKNGK